MDMIKEILEERGIIFETKNKSREVLLHRDGEYYWVYNSPKGYKGDITPLGLFVRESSLHPIALYKNSFGGVLYSFDGRDYDGAYKMNGIDISKIVKENLVIAYTFSKANKYSRQYAKRFVRDNRDFFAENPSLNHYLDSKKLNIGIEPFGNMYKEVEGAVLAHISTSYQSREIDRLMSSPISAIAKILNKDINEPYIETLNSEYSFLGVGRKEI